MADCLDNFALDKTFTITGVAPTKDAAKRDLEMKRDKKLLELETALKCDDHVCLKSEAIGGDNDRRFCRFDWSPTGPAAFKDITRELQIHRREVKRCEAVQTFEVGCFCVGITDKHDEDK